MKSSKIVSGASKNPYLSITHSSAQRVWPAHPGMNVVSSLSTIFQSSLVPYCRPHRCGTTSSRSCFPRRLDVEAYAAFHHRKLELPTFQNPLDVNSSSVLLRQCRNSNYWVVEKILTCSRGSHIFSGQARFWSPSQPQKNRSSIRTSWSARNLSRWPLRNSGSTGSRLSESLDASEFARTSAS